ncbi:MAG: GTP-binding protein [Actinomycetota bacterium]|nr:GTP-binding protein [Actinomycetota bacterium]
MKRTPLIVVAGQQMTDDVCEILSQAPGTIVVRHRLDGHVVVRTVTIIRNGEPHTTQWPMEITGCCVSCTVREDLLVLLRRLHRREDVERIVVHLQEWLEPEPVCWAINNVAVRVGPGYSDGPAARDVRIEAVVSTVDVTQWLTQSLGDDILDDERTVAQVVVGQAEFADVLVLTGAQDRAASVLRRLAPRALRLAGPALLESALSSLSRAARRGREHDAHEALLAGEPPLDADGDIQLVDFSADRPFHPMRLHLAIDVLLDGVVRIRGRAWLASQPDAVVWIESAGGGLHVGHAGDWLAASQPHADGFADPERVTWAGLRWNDRFGDRHISMTALVCGADPTTITNALAGALLTDDELARPQDWPGYPDPFGDWHEDPCDEFDTADDITRRHRGDETP